MPNESIIQEHDAIRQIIGRPPSWILRGGIGVIFIAFIVLGMVAWFVSYPDIVEARIILTSEQPPIKLVTKVSGKLQDFQIQENELVQHNQLIARIESTTDKMAIQQIEAHLLEENKNRPPRENLQLGSIQAFWSDYLKEYDTYKRFHRNDLTEEKISRLENQINDLKRLNSALRDQEKTLRERIALAEKAQIRVEKLKSSGASSEIEVEKTKERYLDAIQALERHQTSTIDNSIKIEQLETQKLSLTEEQDNTVSTLKIQLTAKRQLVRNAIDEWKDKYLIRAPISGNVSLLEDWSNQEFVKAGTALLVISAESASTDELSVRAFLPEHNSGKVKEGMKAAIRMDAFPYKEYGVLNGIVGYISNVPKDAMYQVDLSLPDQLLTTYNKELPFNEEMQGTARIITEKRRLIERLFDQILDLVKNE